MGDVLRFPAKHDPELTKRQLAALWNVSTRTIERYSDPDYMEPRGKAPLPSRVLPLGHRRYSLAAATAWRERNA